MENQRKRDLIGIGGSAGGLPALVDLLRNFEPEERVSVFVVLHRSGESTHLPRILEQSTSLEVREPVDGEVIRDNCLYIASADAHMVIGETHIHLRRGPRENHFRPAIDPLFRSLAVFGSTRSTAVILSGHLDDGAAGARAVVSTGGSVIVQDPLDTLSPSMPRAAISAVGEPDRILPAEEIGNYLTQVAGEEVGDAVEADQSVRLELMIAGLDKAKMKSEDRMGELTPYNCPDCNGVLWEIEDGPLTRYRCHTGHAYSSATLQAKQEEMLERTLFDSLRACRERASFLDEFAGRDPANAERWTARAREYEEDCSLLETLIKQRQKRSDQYDDLGNVA